MSDYIFSTVRFDKGELTQHIKGIYKQDVPRTIEFHGEWGSLSVSGNLYNGYLPYEDDQYIIQVLGGPILNFTDNSKVLNDSGNLGAKKILNRWIEREMKWDEDLSGPFNILIIGKYSKEIVCVTDLMSFIPTYSYQDDNSIFLGTHTSALAKATSQEKNIDEVSLVDFILHSVVTYPYTMYQNIQQLQPASIHKFTKKDYEITTSAYWIPYEKYAYDSLKEAASDLRSGLQSYVNSITSSINPIAHFISGGEDSRMLSRLLPKDKKRDAFIFLDNMNREGKIAKKAADSYGASFNLSTRQKTHYLDILPECSDLVGSGSQFLHVHTYGFHKSCGLKEYPAVFGGLFSDALLKGARIRKLKGLGRFPFLPQIKHFQYSENKEVQHSGFNKSILIELSARRKKHLKYVSTFRKQSSEEWFQLWPSSMNLNIPNIHGNRRLFKSFEPFMSKDVVKISATVPQQWKMNRRLFHKAAKPYLKETKWLFHGDGRLPYFPWYVNIVVHFCTWIRNKVTKKLNIVKGNQGSWGEWDELIKSNKWKEMVEIYARNSCIDTNILTNHQFETILYSNDLVFSQKMNLMQVLYQSKK